MGCPKPVFAISRRRVFSAGMRRVILSQRAMYIREYPGARRIGDAVEAQPKAVTHFTRF